MTWDEYKSKVCAQGGIAREILMQSETSAQIASVMYDVMKEKGVTTKELAKLSGVKESVIDKFELGEISPRLDILVKMLLPLGIKIRATKEIEGAKSV